MQNLAGLFEFLAKSPLDFVLSPERVGELRLILKPLHPKHRMTTGKLSFLEHPSDVSHISNLYLETDLGVLDIVTHVEAVGDFYDVLRNASEIDLYGGKCFLISRPLAAIVTSLSLKS